MIGRYRLGSVGALVALGLCCACAGSEDAGEAPAGTLTPLVASPPLATVDGIGPDGSEVILFARTEGPLEITRECVLLHGPSGPRTVVWTDGRVALDESSGTIIFRDPGLPRGPERLVELEDGQRVAFGGYGLPTSDKLAHEWVHLPAESCPQAVWHAQGISELGL